MEENRISLIIPMAGKGSRFEYAGFEVYKPFLELAGKKMIQGVLSPFSDIYEIYILTTDLIYKNNFNSFQELPEKIKVVIIDEHKFGPGYSIFLARNSLPKNRSYLIAYCDVWWSSLNFDISSLLNYEAAIFVHRGFHPHLIADNFSAFCRELVNGDGKLLEIREKGSFTDNWMSEPVSIGVFFIRDANLLFGSIERMIADNNKAAGEFYPSVIFNYLLANGTRVELIDVDSYIHIGVPSQFNDVEAWSKVLGQKKQSGSLKNDQLNCMLIGGSGSRMKEISEVPKHLLPVNGKPMFEYVAGEFNCSKNILIGAPNFQGGRPELEKSFEIVVMPQSTNSHLETLIKSLEYLPDNQSIFISSCDCYGDIDWSKLNDLVNRQDPDCIVFSFQKSLLHIKNKQQHTTMKAINDLVVDVDIKSKKQSYEAGLAGFFWFKNISVIKNLLNSIKTNGHSEELLVDHLILYAAKSPKKPICYPLQTYIHLGTPDEYKEFHYWNGRGSKLLLNQKGL